MSKTPKLLRNTYPKNVNMKYNKCDSKTFRNKITLDRLKCNQYLSIYLSIYQTMISSGALAFLIFVYLLFMYYKVNGQTDGTWHVNSLYLRVCFKDM